MDVWMYINVKIGKHACKCFTDIYKIQLTHLRGGRGLGRGGVRVRGDGEAVGLLGGGLADCLLHGGVHGQRLWSLQYHKLS